MYWCISSFGIWQQARLCIGTSGTEAIEPGDNLAQFEHVNETGGADKSIRQPLSHEGVTKHPAAACFLRLATFLCRQILPWQTIAHCKVTAKPWYATTCDAKEYVLWSELIDGMNTGAIFFECCVYGDYFRDSRRQHTTQHILANTQQKLFLLWKEAF